MAKSSAAKINLTSYDDIFQTSHAETADSHHKIMQIPLSELHPFENHPFKVLDDEKMVETVESITKYGVLVPVIARPRIAGGYELVAGHRRKRGCELAGLETMPVLVRELDDDEATIIMVDSNLQRESLLFSEKAFAFKMKLEAIKRQAGRPPKNSAQVGPNYNGKLSVEIIADEAGESRNQIKRYIRLTELIPELLEMVDGHRIAFNPAVELSYLTEQEQFWLLTTIESEEATPSLSQAQRIKKFSQDGKLTEDMLFAIMSEEKKETTKITFAGDKLKKYFPNFTTPQQMEETIIKLLENWHKRQQREQSE